MVLQPFPEEFVIYVFTTIITVFHTFNLTVRFASVNLLMLVEHALYCLWVHSSKEKAEGINTCEVQRVTKPASPSSQVHPYSLKHTF